MAAVTIKGASAYFDVTHSQRGKPAHVVSAVVSIEDAALVEGYEWKVLEGGQGKTLPRGPMSGYEAERFSTRLPKKRALKLATLQRYEDNTKDTPVKRTRTLGLAQLVIQAVLVQGEAEGEGEGEDVDDDRYERGRGSDRGSGSDSDGSLGFTVSTAVDRASILDDFRSRATAAEEKEFLLRLRATATDLRKEHRSMKRLGLERIGYAFPNEMEKVKHPRRERTLDSTMCFSVGYKDGDYSNCRRSNLYVKQIIPQGRKGTTPKEGVRASQGEMWKRNYVHEWVVWAKPHNSNSVRIIGSYEYYEEAVLRLRVHVQDRLDKKHAAIRSPLGPKTRAEIKRELYLQKVVSDDEKIEGVSDESRQWWRERGMVSPNE